ADGLQLSGAQRVEVGPGSNWTLDGTLSVDNEAIDYLWVIDDSTSIRGQSQLTADDFDGKGEYEVELIVFDDDGATDSISFEIVISSYDEPLNQLVTPLQGFGLLMALALVLFFVIRSNKKVDFDIPKWNAAEGTLPSENHASSHGRNATVEEDEARG
ncbi:MAG: PKD domain-containing protein, partial [Candidatus Poseidonia sp.]|nr:PKD domain-containing protein [Poseidonia sp.]